jgi:oxaloacetate decarboxylase (Na+ extruding) subunit alpha
MGRQIQVVDQTLRDGQQSLWGMRMQAKHILPIADVIDRAGFHAVDVTGSSLMEVLTRYKRENPWEGLDLIRKALPNSNLRSGSRSNCIVGFALSPNSIMELWIRTLVKHGIDSFWIFDCLFNIDQMRWLSGIVKDAGAKVSPAMMYGLSPVHTDEFFADKVRQMAQFPGVDAIYVEDAPGVLTPDRAKTLVPALVAAAGDVPIEMHCHNNTGMGSLNYLVAVEAGAAMVHTASRPLANGPSLPSHEVTFDNLRRMGYEVPVDDVALAKIAEHFVHAAAVEGYALGVPNEHSTFPYEHQLPGGMTGTLKAQLEQYGMSHRLMEVLEECATVRRELGYPVSATPFSQLVGIQSVLNIVTGERYSVVPDEVILYVNGHLGPLAAPVDPEVMDKIQSSPRAKEFADWEAPQPTLADLRKQYGDVSDEELLLRAVVPAEDVDAMLKAGPVQTWFPAKGGTRMDALHHLIKNADAKYLQVDQPGFSLTLRRQ